MVIFRVCSRVEQTRCHSLKFLYNLFFTFAMLPTYRTFSFSFHQVYDDKLQKLKKLSLDFRFRLREHKALPKAVEALRSSLNLSRTFLVQINNLTDKDDIYTSKDLEELQTIINETTVRASPRKKLKQAFSVLDTNISLIISLPPENQLSF